VGLLALAVLLVAPARSVRGDTASFVNFSLGQPAGVACPGGQTCSNGAAEPAIRSDGAGNFFASSENGLGAGTDAWKSTDGGLHYTALPSPNALSTTAATGVAPGGGDTDMATAPVKNASGVANVYVASLSLANVDVSTSADGGATWALNPIGATIPGDDRPWIAADGQSKVCISYHDLVTANLLVNCSLDAGQTFTQIGDAIDANHLFLLTNNMIGNLAIDPTSHAIYATFSGIANAGEVVCAALGTCGLHAVWMAVSTDGGATFTDHLVYSNPNNQVSYGHQFVNVSVDRAGNAYSVFTDNQNLFYSFSTSQGATWSAPAQVNSAPVQTAIMPWSVAGNAGKLDIVYYGTSFSQAGVVPDNFPSTATWSVYFAQNLTATTAGSAFSQVAASPVVHLGGVCESGVTCTGNRDLFDDFGVAASPVTGMASIVYSDDQFAAGGPNRAGCAAAQNNTAACNHTAVATQTSGSGV
jgi:hypothetical protein